MCDSEENLIIQSDFACVGQVATHCDLKKLCIAISEAQLWDLSELFCDFWGYILQANNQVNAYDRDYANYLIAEAECFADPECTTPPTPPEQPENYGLNKSLLCGGTYESCNNKQRQHLGIKRILVYYAYSRYLLINEFNDTPAGNVSKTNEFSLPKSIKEVQSFADKYRTMGYEAFKKTQAFICANRQYFTEFNSDKCEACGCGNNCNKQTKAKGFGIRSSIIEKRTGYERM